MFQLKIVHKGLILVGVPLLVGVLLNLFVCRGFYLSNLHVERELMFKEAIITYIKTTRCVASIKLCSMTFFSTHDDYYKKYLLENKQNALQGVKHLKALLKLKNEPNIQIPPELLSPQAMMAGARGGPLRVTSTNPFMLDLQKRCKLESDAATQAMNWLGTMIVVSVIGLAFVSVTLALLFCLNVTNRLLLILGNTVSLSQGTALRPPLRGGDEIAELDQFLYKSANEIKELERFKKEMIGVVSHELKSPLSSVGSFLSSLSAGVYGELSEKAKDKADRTYSNVKRLMGLVAELLFLDRLELEMKPEKFLLSELFASAVDNVKELSEKTGVEILVKNNADREIVADRNRLVQVIVNLLSNAMKFSPQDGVVTLEAKESDGYIECRVTDQGRGIPEQFRKQIFEPFKQVSVKDATTKKGTGLGLTISKSIVEQHGGKIGVDSEEGKGSTFWFKIPLDESLIVRSKEKSQHPNALSTLPQNPSAFKLSFSKSGNDSRKFSVLQQGLLIISIPLLFQCVFAGILGYMIMQLSEHNTQEQKSKEVLNILNSGAERFAVAASNGMIYSFTKNPTALKAWETGKTESLAMLDKAENLLGNAAQAHKDIEQTKEGMNRISEEIEAEASKGTTTSGLKNLLNESGLGSDLGIETGL